MVTQFGKTVKIALFEKGITLTEMTDHINKQNDTKFDVQYISNILAGRRDSKPVKEAICKYLDLKGE